MTVPERVRCCVPYCRRTRRNDLSFTEWVCGIHWRAVPHEYRRAYGRLRRLHRRGLIPAGGPRAARLWRRLKRAAIERAAGL